MAATATGVRIELTADRRRLRIVLDGPRGHVITDRMVVAMGAALDRVSREAGIRVVTLEAEPPDFSFGSSIEEHVPERIADVLPRFHDLVRAWLDLPAVTMALVRGRCFGGGFELALACDLIFAAVDASFGLPEIALGVFPPAGAVLLPARIGAARATGAVLSGEPRTAAFWHAAGLVEAIAADGDLDALASRWEAQHLAPRSAAALGHAALTVRGSVRDTIARLLPASERRYLDELMRTHDAREGIEAFLQKRKPNWTDN